MIDNELSKAAERLRRYSEWESNHYMPADDDPYRDDKGVTQSSPQHADDKAEIVAAWLAEHPADSELPVAEEWLRSVGFSSIVGAKPCNIEFGNLQIWPMYIDGLREADWRITRENWRNCQSIPRELIPKTRGEVHRLCAALGIELKERTP